ncbi:type VII secretion-associated protein [Corynebacterium sp.]|uniref:type VII secretion-associated protein n=1 Tax=Corynebacterium sp. TaxID=1720 RepID=UPI0026DCB800|nr:type VII secretion-associated protein [Corynebacterium sp.]MDO5077054.1 type VII secretion-associated protein [Corynebacterium sp.]
MNIVVLDTATVFEAEETTYRYDLTASLVAEDPAAAKSVVDQARDVLQERWQSAEVRIEAPANVVSVLTAAFAGAGVLVKEDSPDPVVPPREPKRLNIPRPSQPRSPAWFIPALGVVVCCVGVACWWGTRPDAPVAQTSAESRPQANSRGGALVTGAEAPSAQPVANNPPELPGVELAHGPLRVRLPEGFRLEQREDGALSATGPDAELRILLAADPVYGVSSDAVYREVELMIERDPALEVEHGEGFREHAVRTIDYRELPGDGSKVRWVTWVESDHQFSMGCHTRSEPTIPQLAACRMAAGTLQIHHDGG